MFLYFNIIHTGYGYEFGLPGIVAESLAQTALHETGFRDVITAEFFNNVPELSQQSDLTATVSNTCLLRKSWHSRLAPRSTLYLVPAVRLLFSLEAMLVTHLLVWLTATTLACALTITTTDVSGETVVEVVTTNTILGIPATSAISTLVPTTTAGTSTSPSVSLTSTLASTSTSVPTSNSPASTSSSSASTSNSPASTSNSPASNSPSSRSSKTDAGAIAGGAIGCVFGGALISALLFWLYKKRGASRPDFGTSPQTSENKLTDPPPSTELSTVPSPPSIDSPTPVQQVYQDALQKTYDPDDIPTSSTMPRFRDEGPRGLLPITEHHWGQVGQYYADIPEL
ncbi:hypothetical protein F5887DRAFT_1237745 [Amanita rubescens]|nr:hypothetical protein F5887DRAFT_1237745 [Amanita rubescens]